MNFTQEIKRELLRNIPAKRCCKCALLCAAIETSGNWLYGEEGGTAPFIGFHFTSENEEVAGYLLSLFERVFGTQMTLTEAVRDPKHGRDKLTFTCLGTSAAQYAEEINYYSPAAPKIETDCCRQAYLRGAFLCGGSCTLPREGKKTGYHLEIGFGDERLAVAFQMLLDDMQIIGNIVGRGDRSVVYLKSREAISDFLSVIGAKSALGTFEEISAVREENNNANRVSNCFAGNADKAAIASAAQVVALTELIKSGALAALPEALALTAQARIDNPTLSLGELAEKLQITKSCLNHRMRKLMQIYGEKTL